MKKVIGGLKVCSACNSNMFYLKDGKKYCFLCKKEVK